MSKRASAILRPLATQHQELIMDKLFAMDRDTLLLPISAAFTGVIGGMLLFALFMH
jgi:hypothetical protein